LPSTAKIKVLHEIYARNRKTEKAYDD